MLVRRHAQFYAILWCCVLVPNDACLHAKPRSVLLRQRMVTKLEPAALSREPDKAFACRVLLADLAALCEARALWVEPETVLRVDVRVGGQFLAHLLRLHVRFSAYLLLGHVLNDATDSSPFSVIWRLDRFVFEPAGVVLVVRETTAVIVGQTFVATFLRVGHAVDAGNVPTRGEVVRQVLASPLGVYVRPAEEQQSCHRDVNDLHCN